LGERHVKKNLPFHLRPSPAFTLLEMMTVIVVISILSLMAYSSFMTLQAKAERAKCVNNLQGLYAAAASHLNDHESWPQISALDVEAPRFAASWMAALKPYHIETSHWRCATVHKAIGSPPDDPQKPRIDYLPTSFDAKPSSPRRFPTHPWFIERADAHGDGNLIILANGQIYSLNDLTPASRH
jgi:prepilin-type N-terminal cleavage/methylation domain-containing protein